MTTAHVSAFLILAAGTVPLAAQQAPGTLLVPGAEVRVTAPAASLKAVPAVFWRVDGDSLRLFHSTTDTLPWVVPLSQVTRLEVKARREGVAGASIVIGALAGALAGAAIGSSQGGPWAPLGAMLYGGLCALPGAMIGLMVGNLSEQRWVPVPLEVLRAAER
jgi:hypothetical protein